jgi:hypothetical protein
MESMGAYTFWMRGRSIYRRSRVSRKPEQRFWRRVPYGDIGGLATLALRSQYINYRDYLLALRSQYINYRDYLLALRSQYINYRDYLLALRSQYINSPD